MMGMNKSGWIFNSLLQYIMNFVRKKRMSYKIDDVYVLIEGRREGGGDLIKHFSSMLVNGGGMKEKGYIDRIHEWTSDMMKRDGMMCLKILFLKVCGMDYKEEEEVDVEEEVEKVEEEEEEMEEDPEMEDESDEGGRTRGTDLRSSDKDTFHHRMKEVWICEGSDIKERREWLSFDP